MNEEWKCVIEFEDILEVSNLGRIRNNSTKIILKGMNHKSNNTTYKRIYMPDGSRKLLHRIVAETFISNDMNKPFINHIDNNGSNNSVSNLEWCTQTENMVHALKQGRLEARILETLPKAHKATKEKHLNIVIDSIGIVFNSWTIFAPSEKRGKDGKIYVFAICNECNTIYERSFSAIKTGETKMCMKCTYKLKKK